MAVICNSGKEEPALLNIALSNKNRPRSLFLEFNFSVFNAQKHHICSYVIDEQHICFISIGRIRKQQTKWFVK